MAQIVDHITTVALMAGTLQDQILCLALLMQSILEDLAIPTITMIGSKLLLRYMSVWRESTTKKVR